MKVAFQGARGAYSHRATQLFAQQMALSDAVEPLSCQSFADAFDAVINRRAEFAAIPLENSSVGTIIPNYDLLAKNDVSIVSEVYVPVQHTVMGIHGSNIESIKEIFYTRSHSIQ